MIMPTDTLTTRCSLLSETVGKEIFPPFFHIHTYFDHVLACNSELHTDFVCLKIQTNSGMTVQYLIT